MAASVPNSTVLGSASFQKVVDALRGGDGLPFAGILSADTDTS